MRPKILNIEEAWVLYKKLGRLYSINPKDPPAMMVRSLILSLNQSAFEDSLDILNKDWRKEKDPVKVIGIFTDGLKENQLWAFHQFESWIAKHGTAR